MNQPKARTKRRQLWRSQLFVKDHLVETRETDRISNAFNYASDRVRQEHIRMAINERLNVSEAADYIKVVEEEQGFEPVKISPDTYKVGFADIYVNIERIV